MSKMKSIVAGASIVASLCAASLPLVSSATTCTTGATCEDSEDLNVNINISPVISMRIVSYSDTTTKTTTCNSVDVTASSDGCTGDTQETITYLMPNDSNVTNNTSSAYSEIYVSTNNPTGYVLTLIDADENINLVNATNDTIAGINSRPVAGSNPGWAVSVGGNGWQIMKHNKNAAGTIVAENPITVNSLDPSASGTVTSNIVDHQSTVYYGYATSTTQPTGIYSDTIEYTATTQ